MRSGEEETATEAVIYHHPKANMVHQMIVNFDVVLTSLFMTLQKPTSAPTGLPSGALSRGRA